MKPANRRWYRDEPRATHVEDARDHPVSFLVRVHEFGWYFGADRICFPEDIEPCPSTCAGYHCTMVAGHRGYHEQGTASWGETVRIPSSG